MVKVCNLQPLPRGLWEMKSSPKTQLLGSTKLNRMAITKLRSGNFGGEMCVGGGLGALQFFGHLKSALELLIPIRMSPLTTF